MDLPPGFLTRFESVAGATARTVVTYDGDDLEFLVVREDVAAASTDGELEETARQLALKGFDDPPDQPELGRLGRLDVTIRWFDEVVVCQLPVGEWSGVLAAYDRDAVQHPEQLTATMQSLADDLRDELEVPLAADEDELSEKFD